MMLFIHIHDDTGRLQIGDCHTDMRKTRQMVAGVVQFQSVGQTCADQQQAGDELGGSGRIDGHRMRRNIRPVGCHRRSQRERQSSRFPVVFDVCAQLLQPVQYRLHRTSVGLCVAVEPHRPVGEHRQSGDEPHHRAGQTAVHVHVSCESPGRRRYDTHRRLVIRIDLELHAQRPQRTHHQIRIARAQQADQRNRTPPHRGQDQIPVRQRLAAGNRNGGGQRSGGQRCGPRVLEFTHSVHRIGKRRRFQENAYHAERSLVDRRADRQRSDATRDSNGSSTASAPSAANCR